ncbi:hypothetical protein TrRE_jg11405, partial [Triparma retinervis]
MDITGDHTKRPYMDTTFKMAYDNEYLYVLGIMEETQVWANITQNNQVIFQDN